jgi:AraC family carnitine catabolism transcriptional activator
VTVVHWVAVAPFRARFPQVNIGVAIYLIDGARISCAGGVATLDMMIELIARLASPALANEVANALVHTPRQARQPQRNDAGSGRGKRLLSDRIVALMEGNLDFPLSLAAIAGRLGVSSKTVVRECHRRFDETPMRLYLKVRLQAARNMLFYEEFGIGEVATACGFSYPAVFSRAFKGQFGTSPREFRAALRRQQNQAFRPEIRRLAFDVPTERRRT